MLVPALGGDKYSAEDSAVIDSVLFKLKIMSLLHRVSSNESVSELRGGGTNLDGSRNRRLSFNPLPPRQHEQAEAVGAYEVPQTKRIGQRPWDAHFGFVIYLLSSE